MGDTLKGVFNEEVFVNVVNFEIMLAIAKKGVKEE